MSEIELAQMFADIAQSIEAQSSVEDALEQSVQLALEAVTGAEMAGISWFVRGKHIETPVATDPLVREIDAMQFDIREGPALEASFDKELSVVDDAATDSRWPAFGAQMARLGVASVLTCPLSTPRRVLGSLNLYARPTAAFDADATEIAVIYAAHASIVLANRSLETDLRSAVETRGLIGQAMGILIERHRVTPKQSFDMMVRVSQDRHVKLRELAAQIVETGVDPT